MAKDYVEKKVYGNWNPAARWYFRKILESAVSISGVSKKDTVLDFGCNTQELKKHLKGRFGKYLGYDIIKELSDIGDYTKTRPDIVFALNVFEHIEEKELRKILDNFKKMKVKRLVTAQPVEHPIGRFLAFISGLYFEHRHVHKLRWFEVHKIVSDYFTGEKQETLLTMQKISLWKAK
ncbi:MAG: hypothetical protein PHH08_04100 [Candidatus ainarchaeum sp.]|nr:hypothetical protein [Candidatus ainarchaeum sp.]